MEMTSAITRSLVDAYRDDGFALVPDSIFGADLVSRASEGMDMIRRGEYDTGEPPRGSPWKPGDDEHALCKIEVPQLANRAIREVCSHPELGRLAAEVSGAEMVQVWWTQMLYKPPLVDTSSNTVIGWHQDWNYWQTWNAPDGLFTAWVALSDVGPDTGPMKFVPGSHRWGDLASDFYGQDNSERKAAVTIPAGETWGEVPAILSAGGVSFHTSRTLHGSEHNHSDRPRCSLAIHMRTEKAEPIDEYDREHGLTSLLENQDVNPVIYGDSRG